MRLIAAIFVFMVFAFAQAHAADQAQAKEVARMNNCPVKKIEVYQQSVGSTGGTVYRVDCNLPKTKDDSAGATASSILVRCDENICEMLRPLPPDSK